MSQKQKRKLIIVVVVIVIFVIAAVAAFLIWNNNSKKKEDSQVNTDSSQEEKKEDSESAKEVEEEPEDEKRVKQYEGEDPNKGGSLTGVVTYAGLAADNLIIRVNIDQYLYDGKCSLKLLRNGGVIYSDKSGIATSATTATCEGFNVPVDGLGGGEIEIVIDLESGGKTGTINGKVEV